MRIKFAFLFSVFSANSVFKNKQTEKKKASTNCPSDALDRQPRGQPFS